MQMNWFAFIARACTRTRRSAATRSASSSTRPRRRRRLAQLGGQGISVVSYSDNQDARARTTSSGSPQPEVQKKWWALGGYLLRSTPVLNDPGFTRPAALRRRLPRRDGEVVKDFWAEPTYALAAAGRAEARPRLCGRRPGHRPGSARRPGQGLDATSSRTTARSDAPDGP